MFASSRGHLNIINRLLDFKDVFINIQKDDGYTALILASHNGHLNIINRLLDCKEIDINIQNRNEETALDIASNEGHLNVYNRLSYIKKKQIHDGFIKSSHMTNSLYIPIDLIDLIVEFVVP